MFAILLGAWFHLFYETFHLKAFTWVLFLYLDLTLLAFLCYCEKKRYTVTHSQMMMRFAGWVLIDYMFYVFGVLFVDSAIIIANSYN